MADKNPFGIQKVDPQPWGFQYVSSYKGSGFNTEDVKKRSRHAVDFMNQPGVLEGLNPIEGTKFRTTSRAKRISDFSQSINDNPSSVFLLDTETLGSSKASTWGTDNAPAFFEVPQVAIQERVFEGNNFKKGKEYLLVTGISSESEALLRNKIDEVRKNPLKWNTYTEEVKRSMLDTILYSDEGNFVRKEIEGEMVKSMSSQVANIPSTAISATNITSELKRMEAGISNLTNTNLVSTAEETAKNITRIIPKGAHVLAYNAGFDEKAISEHFGAFIGHETLSTFQPVDVYGMAQVAFENNPAYQQPNLKMESVYRHYFGSADQSHFAMGDVDMMAQIIPKLQAEEAVQSHIFQTTPISPDDIFVATKGIQANPNAYNAGENLYSFPMRRTSDGKGYELAENLFQPNPVVRNQQYRFLGQTTGPVIDDVQMFAFMMEDVGTGNINTIFSPEKNYMLDNFAKGHFQDLSKLPESERSYYAADTARRAYERLFDGDIDYKKDDPVVELRRTLDFMEEYQAMGGNATLTVAEKDSIVEKMYDKHMDAWRKTDQSKRAPSFAKMRNAAYMEPVLSEEAVLWRKAIQTVDNKYPLQNPNDYLTNRQRGNFLYNVQQGLQENLEQPQSMRVGKSGQKLFELSLDVSGDVSYLNASDPSEYRSSIRRSIMKGKNQPQSDVQGRIHVLLNRVAREGGEDVSGMVGDLRAQVLSDLGRYGEVRLETLNDISDKTYGIISGSENLVSGVEATYNQARYAGVYAERKYPHQLVSKKDDFYETVIEDALEQSARSYTGVMDISQSIQQSSNVSKKISVNNSTIKNLQDTFNSTQQRFGLDQGEVRRHTNQLRFKDFDAEEAIAKTISQFEQNKFEVALTTNEATGRMELFYAPKELDVGLINKNYTDLLNDNRIGKQVMPLYNAGYGLDVQSGSIASGFSINIDPSLEDYPYQLVSNQETYFDEIGKMSSKIRREIDKEIGKGRDVDYENILTRQSRWTNKRMTENKSYIGFGQFLNMDDVAPNAAAPRAIMEAGLVDSEPIVLSYLEKRFPDTYKRWESYSDGNYNANLFNASSFWREETRNFGADSLQQIQRGAMVDFYEKTGVSFNLAGVSTNKQGAGMVSLANPQMYGPFGFMDSRRRETGVKAPNILPFRREQAVAGREAHFRRKYAHLAGNPDLYESNVKRATLRSIDEHAMLGHQLLNASGNVSDNVAAAQLRTARLNDIDMNTKAEQAIKRLAIKQEELKAELLTFTPDSSEYKEIQKLINQNNERRNLMMTRLPAVHEGQMIISQSAASSMVTKSVKEVSLGDGELLPEQLLRAIAEQNGVEYVEGQGLGLSRGQSIAMNLSSEEMQTLGLLSPENELTVGKAARYDSILGSGEYSTRIASSNRIQEDSILKQVSIGDDGQILLQIQETRAFQPGDKLMTTSGDLRVSAEIVEDEIFDLLGLKDVDAVMEHNKFSRENPGAILDSYNRTIQENIWEDLESIDLSAVSDLDELEGVVSPGVMRGLRERVEGGVTLQDLDIEEVANSLYLEQAAKIGLTSEGDMPSLILNPMTGSYEIDPYNVNKDMITGPEGTRNIQDFLRSGVDDFRLDEEYLVTEFTIHNTGNYSGTTSKPKLTFREHEMAARTQQVYYPDGRRSVMAENMQRLFDKSDREAYTEYAGRLFSVSGMSDSDVLDAAHREGNVLIDMSGRFEADAQRNFYRNDEGLLVVDGLSLPEGRGDNVYGSLQQANTITLYNDELEGFEQTRLGDYLKENEAMAFLKTQDEGDNYFNETYVPIVGNINEVSGPGEVSYTRSTDNAMLSMADAVKQVNQAETQEDLIKGIDKFSAQNARYYDEIDSIAENSRSGSIVKKTSEYQTQHGGSYRAGTFNQMTYYDEAAGGTAKNALRHSNVELSRDSVRAQIEGLEDNILMANQITAEQITASNKSKMDYILDRLSDVEDTEFSIFNTTNRHPNQTMGNIQVMNLRVSDAVSDNRANISPGAASLLKADFDGDYLSMYLDYYRDDALGIYSIESIAEELNLDDMYFTNKEQRKMVRDEYNRRKQAKLVELQSDLVYRNEEITETMAKAAHHLHIRDNSDINESLLHKILNNEQGEYFKDRNTMLDFLEDSISAEVMGKNVGIADNLRMKTMTGLQEYTKVLQEAGIPTGSAEHAIKSIEQAYDPILQNAISAKKMTSELIGFTDDMTAEQLLSTTRDFTSNYNEFLENLQRPTSRNIDRIVELGEQLQFTNSESAPDFRSSLEYISDMNQTYQQLGINTASASLGLSSGTPQRVMIDAIANEDFSGLLLNNTTETYVRENAPHLIDMHAEARQRNAQRVADAVTSKQATRAAGSKLSDVAAEGLEELGDIAQKSTTYNKIRQNSEMSGTIKSAVGRTVSSPLFAVGAGLAAGWILSSAIRSAPTPEGNEAQQEATPVEVAPAMLLTSPTARVTPRGENITMNISGRGNVDNEEIIGIVNQQLQSQTSMDLNMNIHQTDNITSLDSKFYEEKISSALGLN